MYTANTMASIAEGLGMAVPGVYNFALNVYNLLSVSVVSGTAATPAVNEQNKVFSCSCLVIVL